MRVLAALRELLEARVARAVREIESLDLAAEGESHGSAGDKYETAREMFAQSRGLQAGILRDAREGLEWIRLQDSSRGRESVSVGAVFLTHDGWHLACPFPGEFEAGADRIRAVSMASPLGQALKGARVGERREFRGRVVEILELE